MSNNNSLNNQNLNDFLIQKTSAGTTVTETIQHTSNTAGSTARSLIQVAGATASDPFTSYEVSGVTTWSTGLDNSAADAYKIAASSALGTTDTFVSTTAGEITTPLNACFHAYVGGGSIPAVTGAGAAYTIIFGTESFDIGGNYNNATGIFTAPITGNYAFNADVSQLTLTATMTTGFFDLSVNAGARVYRLFNGNYAAVRNPSNGFETTSTQILALTAADTVSVILTIQNGVGNTAGIQGVLGVIITTQFSGRLIA